jgi:hypothetical protein
MQRITTSLAVLMWVLVVGGCATMEDVERKGPPAEVTVYREPSTSDSLFRMLFAVDGRPLAQLNPGDEYRFQIPAGDHRFQYVLGVYDCSEDVGVEAGETYVYRLSRGCAIEEMGDRGAAARADTHESQAGNAKTWAAEMEALEARETREREAEDESYITW